VTHQDCLEIAKNLELDDNDNQLVIVSAPKGSVLEAHEEEDGSSMLTMSSASKGEINVYIVDTNLNTVLLQKG
jgi:hypothetical protein